MKFFLNLIVILFALIGYAKNDATSNAVDSAPSADGAKSVPSTLAYEHALSLQVEATVISGLYASIQTNCKTARAEHCVMLDSNLNTGDYPSATIKIRASASGIQNIIASLKTQGDIIQQSVKAEDLAGPIGDNEKRLTMLKGYRESLEALRLRANADIDNLIRINSELASVQAEIESITGQQFYLKQRIATELLTIDIRATHRAVFWRPIFESLAEFKTDFSESLASAIRFIAYALPWIFTLLLFFWLGRKLWRARAK